MDRQEIVSYELKRIEIAQKRIEECETEVDRLQACIDELEPPPLDPPERPVTSDLIFLRKQAD